MRRVLIALICALASGLYGPFPVGATQDAGAATDEVGITTTDVQLEPDWEPPVLEDLHDEGLEDDGHSHSHSHGHDDGDRAALLRTVSGVIVPHDPGVEMVAIDPGWGSAFVRSRGPEGWSEWVTLAGHADGPDSTPGGEGATDTSSALGPLWIGEGATELEVVVPGNATNVRIHSYDTGVAGDGLDPAASSPQASLLANSQPSIKPRSAWATGGWAHQNDGCEDGPRTSPGLRALVVHHTVTSNAYSQADVPKLLRGIHAFHTATRGWCDVAYNFFVDRFGTIWEGRTDSIRRPIIGGHARGFNTHTVGVALLGQHQGNIRSPRAASPAAAAIASIEALGTWKLSLHGVDPKGTVWLKNEAYDGVMKFAGGQYINLPTILAHRDLGQTSCPGSYTMGSVRNMPNTIAANRIGQVPRLTPAVSGSDWGPKVIALDNTGALRPALQAAAVPNPPSVAKRAIAVGGHETAGFVLYADGTLGPYGAAPAIGGAPGGPNPVDLVVRESGKSGYVITADGHLHGFGGTVRDRAASGPAVAGDVNDFATGYVVDAKGVLHPIGATPPAKLNSAPRGGVVDLVLRSDALSGWVLDGTGALRGFGGPADFGSVTSAPVAVVAGGAGGGGWVLDSEGRLHRFGSESIAAPVQTHVGHAIAADAVLTNHDLRGTTFRKSSDAKWIQQIMSRVFGRTPNDFELYRWSWRIDEGGTKALATTAVNSEGYLGRIVDAMYASALKRPADAGGRAYWLNLVATGQITITKFAENVYASPENVRRLKTNAGFVTELYKELLHRAPDAEGLNYWVGQMDRGRLSPAGVVKNFYESIESRRDRAQRLFSLGLNGPGALDAEAVEKYAARLAHADDRAVAIEILSGPEYYLKVTG